MKARLRSFLYGLWTDAVDLNERNLMRAAAEVASSGKALDVCDLGAGDGVVTSRVFDPLLTARVVTVEGDDRCGQRLRKRGFEVVKDDLNAPLTLGSDCFDLVLSNQVIEHLYDTEGFLDEAVRILKPGGRLIVSTENPASWHNIGALTIGLQSFSLANISRRRSGIGNPFGLSPGPGGWPFPLQHHRLFAPRALIELFQLCGITKTYVRGAGYYPLPAALGLIDTTHAAFITVVGTKTS